MIFVKKTVMQTARIIARRRDIARMGGQADKKTLALGSFTTRQASPKKKKKGGKKGDGMV